MHVWVKEKKQLFHDKSLIKEESLHMNSIRLSMAGRKLLSSSIKYVNLVNPVSNTQRSISQPENENTKYDIIMVTFSPFQQKKLSQWFYILQKFIWIPLHVSIFCRCNKRKKC